MSGACGFLMSVASYTIIKDYVIRYRISLMLGKLTKLCEIKDVVNIINVGLHCIYIYLFYLSSDICLSLSLKQHNSEG